MTRGPHRRRFDVDAILFDIDGTLVDSTAVVDRASKTWATRHGIDLDELQRCHGWRTEDMVARLLPVDERASAIAELEELELADLDVIALPSASTLLRDLPADRWAAVTSGTLTLMRARLTAAGLPTPAVLIAAEDVSAGKPDPEGYLKAAAGLGYGIARCLVVEDAPAGVQAGLAAGAHVLAVATNRPAADLTTADIVIPDLTACTVQAIEDTIVVTTQTPVLDREPSGC